MALETGTYISDLVVTNPAVGDDINVGDDHLRLLKATIKATFPNITGEVTPTHTELNYVDGVTSAIQTQLNAKAATDSPALTGTPTAPTAASSTNTTQLATTAFVQTAVGGVNAAGAWTRISTTDASNSATIDFTGLSSTYDEYMVTIIAAKPSTDNVALYMRTSTDGGVNYDAGSTDYSSVYVTYTIGSDTAGGAATVAQIQMGASIGNVAGGEQGYYGSVDVFKPSAAAYTHIMYRGTYRANTNDHWMTIGSAMRNAGANVDAIRFLMSSGNIASGTFNLYGRRK